MIGASKILTVSYGTFSCTLEGFDEPFNTMKAIAEYFRDLAAEDRYFGAEPPIPDAAMLHKIAEREIHRRVEAKIQDNGVILRAGDAMDGPAPSPTPSLAAPFVYDNQQDDAPKLADAAVSAESVAAKLSKLRAAVPATSVAAADPAPVFDTYTEDQHFEDLSVCPTLLPVASADPVENSLVNLIANQAAVTDIPDQLTGEMDVIQDDFAEVSWADQDEDEAALPIQDIAPSPQPSIADDSTDDDFDDQAANLDALIDFGDQDAQNDLARIDGALTAAVDQPALIADSIQGLSANDQPVDSDFSDDLGASDDALLASLGSLIAKNDQIERAELDDEYEDEFGGFEDEISEHAAIHPALRAEVPVTAAEISIENNAFEVQAATIDEPEVVLRARARVIKIRRADAAPMAALPVAAAPQPNLLSDEAEAALQAELAALEAEIAPPAAIGNTADPASFALPEEDAFDPNHLDSDVATTATIAGDLADDDLAPAELASGDAFEEHAFRAELAEIAADPAPVLAQPVRPMRPVRSIAVTRDLTPAAAERPSSLEPSADLTFVSQVITEEPVVATEPRHDIQTNSADQAVGRLMEQANSVLDDADVKRRQSAIAHLKAAVAATEAERLVAPSVPRTDMMDSYRSDLESVVRPNPASLARVGNADRPQPLVLVSAQRIDRLPRPDDAVPRMVLPVRPRRIGAAAPVALHADSLIGMDRDDDLDEGEGLDDAAVNLFAETESFADFADRLGASELPDVLEAAAVYCASVLGRPEFSRPLVLRQIATLPATAGLSREDGLRVFGTLMRQGRIAKTRRGQFAVTDRSPLLAEALRSAG